MLPDPYPAAPASAEQQPPLTAGSRALILGVSLVLGGLFGVLGTVVHQISVSLFGLVDLPIGLVIALPAVALLLVGLRLLAPTRWAAFLAAVGVVGVVALLALPGPGGSVLIPDSTAGAVWVVGATLVSVVVLAWPRVRGARPAAS